MHAIWTDKARVWAIWFVAVSFGGSGAVAWTVAAPPASDQRSRPHRLEEIEGAVQAMVKGQTDEAYKLLQDAVKKYPDLPPARLMLSRIHKMANLDAENDTKYRSLLEQAATENPDHVAVYVDLANNAALEGRSTEALLDCQKLLELSAAPRWTEPQKRDCRMAAREIGARVHNNRREWTAAADELKQLLGEVPTNCRLRNEYAKALLGLAKPDEAFRELTQAYEINSVADWDANVDWPILAMAKCYAAIEDTTKAREWFNKASQDAPESLELHVAYAKWLLKQNDLSAAKQHAEKARKISPDNKLVPRILRSIADTEKPVDVGGQAP
jgi:tetratricopeptide (TPR) repeat protein